jgi:hypothetical protein
MAIISMTNQTVIKPDVYDVLIGDFDAAETPMFNQTRRGPDSPNAQLFDWAFDKPDTPVTTGAPEGTRFAQADAVDHGGRALMYGRMHHYKEVFGVGEVAEGNKVFGTDQDSQFAYEMTRSLRLAMTSAEAVLVGTQENQAGNKTTEFRTRGLQTYIVDTAGIAVQTDTPTVIPADFRPAAAQIQELTVVSSAYTLTEDQMTAPFDAIYNALKAKMDLDIFATPAFMKQVANFGKFIPVATNYVGVRRFNSDAEDMKVTAVINTYVGPTGTARIQLHPYLSGVGSGTAEALGLNMKYMQLRMRKAPSSEELPKQSAGREGFTEWTFGLQVTPKYQAKWKASA